MTFTLNRRQAFAYAGSLALISQAPTAWAQGSNIAVQYPASIMVNGRELLLNGSGIRYKAMFQVYSAGLYLEKSATSSDNVHKAPGIKQLKVTMLRDINASELGNLFTRGILNNNPSNVTTQLLASIGRMGDIFSRYKSLQTGEQFIAQHVPGQGMTLSVKGTLQDDPFEENFFAALLNIWLGPKPADQSLKQALLGEQPSDNQLASAGGA